MLVLNRKTSFCHQCTYIRVSQGFLRLVRFRLTYLGRMRQDCNTRICSISRSFSVSFWKPFADHQSIPTTEFPSHQFRPSPSPKDRLSSQHPPTSGSLQATHSLPSPHPSRLSMLHSSRPLLDLLSTRLLTSPLLHQFRLLPSLLPPQFRLHLP